MRRWMGFKTPPFASRKLESIFGANKLVEDIPHSQLLATMKSLCFGHSNAHQTGRQMAFLVRVQAFGWHNHCSESNNLKSSLELRWFDSGTTVPQQLALIVNEVAFDGKTHLKIKANDCWVNQLCQPLGEVRLREQFRS